MVDYVTRRYTSRVVILIIMNLIGSQHDSNAKNSSRNQYKCLTLHKLKLSAFFRLLSLWLFVSLRESCYSKQRQVSIIINSSKKMPLIRSFARLT